MENIDLIESVLASGEAFVVPPSRRGSTIDQASPELPSELSEPSAVEASSSAPETAESSRNSGDSDTWKEEYESQVQAWRAQSAEARDKAEKERARWEVLRAEEAAHRKAAGIKDESPAEIPTGIPNVHSLPIPSTEWKKVASSGTTTTTAVAAAATVPEPESLDSASQKWVDVQASTSSFPSTFPERTEPSSPTRQVGTTTSTSRPAPSSATLAIFDPSLSTKTRVVALLSALAINLALPFVNGVMLGFGEIFAKNIVLEWFGWKPVGPGSLAGTAGLRSTRARTSPFR